MTNKLNIRLKFEYPLEYYDFLEHRSGWKNVIREIIKINGSPENNDREILLLDFMENKFNWKHNKHLYKSEPDKIPDWIGIWHNPPNMPKWFNYDGSPQSIIQLPIFKDYIKKCRGIIVLSEYMAKWVRENIPATIPISVLYHPTDDCEIKFNYDNFMKNENKCLLQIGVWLRRLCAIGCLKTTIYKKKWLYNNGKWIFNVLEQEQKQHSKNNEICSSMSTKITDNNYVERVVYSNDEYDDVLSENICFLYLYDSSANNAIIECIARNTPVLVNRHPAVVEYLGEAYPFYYDTLDQVSLMVEDFDLIYRTHQYMVNNKEIHYNISYDKFVKDFVNCDVITLYSSQKIDKINIL